MNLQELLSGPSFSPHKKPKKIIFMLHGYGDSGDNFIHFAKLLDQPEWKANYISLNAPSSIPNLSLGRQWFDLYPNGVYIADAGNKEIKIINKEILITLSLLEKTIRKVKNDYGISFADCMLLGFSQGAMIAFEFGNFFKEKLGGLAILSGQIMFQNNTINKDLLSTPIFISHGTEDNVLPFNLFVSSCIYLTKNNFTYESHILEGDTHTISPELIKLLQYFIKKNLS